MDMLKTNLQIGYAKIDITPDYSVGLGGYSNSETRRSEGVAMPIYTTCIAMKAGDETILLFTIDKCGIPRIVCELIRESVCPATGIPFEKVFIGATHAHSAPDFTRDEPGRRYKQQFVDGAVKAAQEALADLTPATVEATTTHVPNRAFVRHYITANGTYAGSNFGTISKENPAIASILEADDTMVLVKFVREGKKNVLLVNWGVHCDMSKNIGFTLIAPSFPGPLRNKLEELTGDHVAYFTAASGNIGGSSRVKAIQDTLPKGWIEYGEDLAKAAYAALPTLQKVEGTGIQTCHRIVTVDVDHSWDPMIQQANEVFDLWKTVGKEEGDALGKTYNFTSSYQARAIRTRYNMEKTTELELNTFRVGGLGFTTGTYEMFSESGKAVREGSPFEFTFLVSGNASYIPSTAAYDYRCYEADTGLYARGTAEKLIDEYLEMLNEVK
ncbi:MAG: hypothetical protein IJB02_01645 [Oscillospiraceae bacterium]|nr:hypothetical protein [Oscillospiraceae bacterium]